MADGWHVICPAAMWSSSTLLRSTVGRNFDWYEYDLYILERCDTIAVIKLSGWERSNGVRLETEFMHDRGKLIESIDIETEYYAGRSLLKFKFRDRMFAHAW